MTGRTQTSVSFQYKDYLHVYRDSDDKIHIMVMAARFWTDKNDT